MKVGGAGGQGAVVIPEAPGESQVTRCCASVNRHGREGEGRQTNVHVTTPMLLYITHARKSHVQMRIIWQVELVPVHTLQEGHQHQFSMG